MKNLFVFMAILSLFACNDTSEKKSNRRKSKIRPTTTEQSPEEYYGNWEGTYDGDDQGEWAATIYSNGVIGKGRSYIWKNEKWSAKGKVAPNGKIQLTSGDVSSGATFTGQINQDKIEGVWVDKSDGLKGTWKGQKISP